MHGHGHALVVIVNTADKLGEVELDVSQRQHGHGQKYDQIRQNVEHQPLSRQVIAGRTIVHKTTSERPFLCSRKGLWPW
jgi:hypothetical protein